MSAVRSCHRPPDQEVSIKLASFFCICDIIVPVVLFVNFKESYLEEELCFIHSDAINVRYLQY